MSSGGGSNQLPHNWHLDAMVISSARAFRIAPASLSSCLAEDDPQPRRGHLACAFGMNPSSPAGPCRYGCHSCASGTIHHLLLLLGPMVHHVTKFGNSFWSVPPKISIDAWVGEAIVEAVDDVLFRDVRMVARTSKKRRVYDHRSLLHSCLH
jgi:hypothetical protein